MLDRRTVLASTLALPACAATPRLVRRSPPCLTPVNVDPSRIIRSVAGLRPYRASGFVVGAENVGATRIVHNYGHGGSGITLSWGTSRLATQIGLPGHSGAVAVIGAGVMGLTTARLCQEAGFAVTLYAKALPPDTTSNIAGGQWAPSTLYEDDAVTPAWREQFRAAMDYSWRRFQIMVGDDYGIRWLPTYQSTRQTSLDPDPYMPGAALLADGSHPFAGERILRYTTMYVETGRFLRQLTGDFENAGGRIVVREFHTPSEIAALPERLAFNCTGLGAKALFGDTQLLPIRGQLAILLPQPEVQYAYAGRAGYMFPRADGILLGGTFERGESDPTPQPGDIARILANHGRVFGSRWRCPA
ncbi:FAD-dependent oxidoreductase [Sphingomonas japonica]|uniref:D-amino-acid oxidase n=1 Tax=Sphingomonas japonica TaxID=511662 RepID=A0ABX0TXY7_9SPHN|nr:FAD-dependent oxidoreductase [Sphingomonas japonica]NIJ23176.1 glycine/D-amino acid oxidase-like deaminating enzyme [Sphingomonas japonica]